MQVAKLVPPGYGAVGYLWGFRPCKGCPVPLPKRWTGCGDSKVRTQPRGRTRGSLRSRTEATREVRGILDVSPYFALRCGDAHLPVEAALP